MYIIVYIYIIHIYPYVYYCLHIHMYIYIYIHIDIYRVYRYTISHGTAVAFGLYLAFCAPGSH